MQSAWSPLSLPTRPPEVLRLFKFIIRNSQDAEWPEFLGFGEAKTGRMAKNGSEWPGMALEWPLEWPEWPPYKPRSWHGGRQKSLVSDQPERSRTAYCCSSFSALAQHCIIVGPVNIVQLDPSTTPSLRWKQRKSSVSMLPRTSLCVSTFVISSSLQNTTITTIITVYTRHHYLVTSYYGTTNMITNTSPSHIITIRYPCLSTSVIFCSLCSRRKHSFYVCPSAIVGHGRSSADLVDVWGARPLESAGNFESMGLTDGIQRGGLPRIWHVREDCGESEKSGRRLSWP